MPKLSNTQTAEAMVEEMARINEYTSLTQIGTHANVTYMTVKAWITKQAKGGDLPKINPHYVEMWFRADNPLRTKLRERKQAVSLSPSS